METTTQEPKVETENQPTPQNTDVAVPKKELQKGPADNNPPIVQQPKSPILIGEEGLILKSFDDMWRLSVVMSASDIVPKQYRGRPENAFIGMQYGMELGFNPMQALQCVDVINGKPGLGGDASLALVRGKGLLEIFRKEKIGEKGTDSYGYRVTVKRKGMADEQVEEYTVGMAKTAKLWGKVGPWQDHPERQLYYRPLGYCLRDQFSDVLKGIVISEELMDYPEERNERTQPSKPSGPKFDTEAIAASNGTAKAPEQPSEPLKSEEAEFKDVPEKADTAEPLSEVVKPDAPEQPKVNGQPQRSAEELQAEFEMQFPK